MPKTVRAKKKGNTKVKTAIRRRINRDFIQHELELALRSFQRTLDKGFLNEMLTLKESMTLADAVDVIDSLVAKTFNGADPDDRIFPIEDKTFAELDYKAALNWLGTFQYAESPLIRNYVNALVKHLPKVEP